MTDAELQQAVYEGIQVELSFAGPGPTFGDLFLICGQPHPRFPATGRFACDRLADLMFSQVDDYFGVRSLADDGTDVVIWLYPLVDGTVVHHHPGPFTGLRLHYSVLRNPTRHIAYFLRVVTAFSTVLGVPVHYLARDLGCPPDVAVLQADINQIVTFWTEQGITPGSEEALAVEY